MWRWRNVCVNNYFIKVECQMSNDTWNQVLERWSQLVHIRKLVIEIDFQSQDCMHFFKSIHKINLGTKEMNHSVAFCDFKKTKILVEKAIREWLWCCFLMTREKMKRVREWGKKKLLITSIFYAWFWNTLRSELYFILLYPQHSLWIQ